MNIFIQKLRDEPISEVLNTCFDTKTKKKDLDSDTFFAISSTSFEQAVCKYITPTSVQAKSVQFVLIR